MEERELINMDTDNDNFFFDALENEIEIEKYMSQKRIASMNGENNFSDDRNSPRKYNKNISKTLIVEKNPTFNTFLKTDVKISINEKDYGSRETYNNKSGKNDKNESINFDINFFKKYFKPIHVKNSKVTNKFYDNLFEIQEIEIEKSIPIWVIKISNDGQFMAVGGKSGSLKIFKLVEEDPSFNIENNNDFIEFKSLNEINSNKKSKTIGKFNFIKLIDEGLYRVYNDHIADIVDLCWGNNKNSNLVITASLDNYVILYDVNKSTLLEKFEHFSMVTCIVFCPNNEDNFASGSMDKVIRIWNITKKKYIDYINTQDYITALNYFPTGLNIVAGFHNGKCSIFEVNPKLKYSSSFECKNKFGKNSKGKKVAGLEFINKNELLITTSDSRIRLININDNKLLQKYKGLKNEEIMIKAGFEESNNLVFAPSEDGYVCVWRKYINLVPPVNTSYNPFSNTHLKNSSYEYFRPFEKDFPTTVSIVNEFVLINYQKRFFTNKIFLKIRSIFVIGSIDGKIKIFVDPVFLDNE